ncbi:MAG: LCP family protein [Chloroflexota bacterium]|nr:LCP family protein [Chloroflexota bacterium]
MPDRTRRRHPALAATLSFVFPGLGQAYAGRPRTAVLLAGPVVAVIGAASVVAATRWSELSNELLSSKFLWTLIVIDLALLGWRLAAIGHAWLTTDVVAAPEGADVKARFPVARARLVTDRQRRSPTTLLAVTLLAAATIGMHGYIALLAGTLNQTLDSVFAGEEPATTAGSGAQPAEHPATGGGERRPISIPEYHWNGTERINFLLLGVDSGVGRTWALDDTILVVSVDPADKKATLVSIPRDTGYMPLPDESVYPGGVYPRRINELATEARNAPALWCPDLPPSVDCGLRSLERSVGLYLGIQIHYYAQVDLAGFSELIDQLGGVDVCLRGRLVDPGYTGPTWYDRPDGIVLEPGCHRLEGPEALAYARIRKGWLELPNGEIQYQNDFRRAERQQELLLALRRELAAIPVFELPGVLNAIAHTVSTDFPRSFAGDLASLLPSITRNDVRQVVLGYPAYVDPPVDEINNYLLIPRREAIRDQMEFLFGADGPLRGWYVGSDAASPSDPAAVPAPPAP